MSGDIGGSGSGGYFSRAWALVTGGAGWFKPVLVLSVAPLVPIVGSLGALGYCVEWARLVAWGADAAPKQGRVAVGACIASGWRSFLVSLAWALIVVLLGEVLSVLPRVGGALDLLWSLASLALGVVASVAVLRASLYQRVTAGLRPLRVLELCGRDPKGLLKVFCIEVLVGLVVGLATTAFVILPLSGTLPALISEVQALGPSADSALVAPLVARYVSAAGPGLAIAVIASSLLASLASLVCWGVIGLWLRQFSVPSWGPEESPAPDLRLGEGAGSD